MMYAFPGIEHRRLDQIIADGFARIDRAVDRIIEDYEQGLAAAEAVGAFLVAQAPIKLDPMAAYLQNPLFRLGIAQQNSLHNLISYPQLIAQSQQGAGQGVLHPPAYRS